MKKYRIANKKKFYRALCSLMIILMILINSVIEAQQFNSQSLAKTTYKSYIIKRGDTLVSIP